MAASIALYGSAARGDSDEISDVDLLIVANSADEIDIATSRFSTLNANVSAYYWRRFEKLSNAGSLFVQHVRDEGQVLEDPENRLSRVLEKFTPSESYSQTIESSRRILTLISSLCDGPHSRGWAFDILAVGFRGVAVPLIATTGNAVFSYVPLLHQMAARGFIEVEDVPKLLQLRAIKRAYREGECNLIPDWAYLKMLCSLLATRLNLCIQPCKAPPNEVLAYVLRALEQDSFSGYEKLRLIELGVVAIRDSDQVPYSVSWDYLCSSCQLPAAYSFSAGNVASTLHSSATKLFKRQLEQLK